MLRLPAFLRRFVRRHSKPKQAQDAFIKRKNISLLYAFITWNLFGIVVLAIYKQQKSDPKSELSPGRYYTDIVNEKNVTVKRFSGFQKVGEYNLDEEKKKYGHLLTDSELSKIREKKYTEELKE